MQTAAAFEPMPAAAPSYKHDVIRNFTPSWCTIAMGTASIFVSILGVPWRFTGQDELALVVWCLTAVLFAVISATMLLRVVLYPSSIQPLLEDPQQPLFLAVFPMTLSTLNNGVIFMLLARTSAAAVTAAEALFWINLPAVLGCNLVVPYKLATLQANKLTMPTMTATWLMPALPALVAANTAAVVASVSKGQGLLIIVVGLCLLGMGFLLSYQISGAYYSRLMCYSMPPKEVIVSSFMPMAPMAMTAWALLDLTSAAQAHLPALQGVILGGDDAAIKVLILAVVLMLWGFAVWWLVLAVACVSSCIRQGLPFNLGWWGSVFPVGVFAGTTLAIGSHMDSDAFRGIGTACVVLHVLLWLFVSGATIRGLVTGRLFAAPPGLDNSRSFSKGAAAAPAAGEGLRQPHNILNTDHDQAHDHV